MNFKEYVDNLNKIIKANPKAAEFEVVTSIDDEGNGFNPVNFCPSIGHYDERERDFDENGDANAVCVN